QHAQAEAKVLPQLLKPYEAPYFPRIFLDPRHVAELAQRSIPRSLRRQAALDVVLRLPLDEVADVLVEVLHHALAAPEQPIPEAHGLPSWSAGRRIRAMAPASFSHLPVSTVNCRLPRAVSR